MFANKRAKERQGWLSWWGYFLLMALTFWVLYDPDLFGRDRVISHGRIPSTLGAAVFLAGFIMAIWSRLALGSNWSGRITLKEDHELIERGPYRFVRHPMYTGLILGVLGNAIVLGTPAALAAALMFLVLHIWKLRREEQLLIRHFPESYPAYQARTKALIPFVF